jgi:hypothetical protein
MEADDDRWEIGVCTSCEHPYPHKFSESYRIMCIPCYKGSRGWTLTQSDNALIVLQMALRRSILKERAVRVERVIGNIPIRDLMILCHPDKHNGSKKSTQTFQKLVDLKTKK